MRGWLNDEHGVSLKDVHWYQAGANEAGRIEKVELDLPKDVKLTRVVGQIAQHDARKRRDRLRADRAAAGLFPEAIPTSNGCFRTIRRWNRNTTSAPRSGRSCTSSTVQKHVLDENPWVARNLFNAFVEVETPQPRAPSRPCRIALSAAVVAGLRTQDAGHVRWRHIPLRDRREPADARAIHALHLRAGNSQAPRQTGRDLPEGHHDARTGLNSALRGDVRRRLTYLDLQQLQYVQGVRAARARVISSSTCGRMRSTMTLTPAALGCSPSTE